jgi:putative transposase
MRAGQFSDEQIVAMLQKAATGEKTVANLCQEKGISEATFYAWHKKFHDSSTKDVQKLHEL